MIGVPGVAGRAFTALSMPTFGLDDQPGLQRIEHLLRRAEAEADHALAALERVLDPSGSFY